jgi:predicted  nucleic acid-binding Zn-ribbon protein
MVAPGSEAVMDAKATPDGAGDEERAKDGDNAALEDAQVQHQEEIHGYIERIDALEAKLQFLAREATDAARQAALAAPAGSVEKKLAEKDQQIAQLMEEGKNLASTDHKHRALVKKLRATIADNEKELGTLRTARDKSDREIENLRSRARRADELEKAHDDLQKRLDQTQKELNTLRPEIRSKDSTIAELRAQLQKATEQADAMTAKVNIQAREQDKRRIADLEEEVAALKVEKNLVADRGKAQAAELREKAERASERARALELELKAEVQVMEGKLEAMRMRAEEASSGAAGDSQAKLLRQVETLQTQYSIASENWQGIETTLLARITSLEKERDEALQRESEMRRKAREAVSILFSVGLDVVLTLCRLSVQSARRRSWKRPRPRSLQSKKTSRPTRLSSTLSRGGPRKPNRHSPKPRPTSKSKNRPGKPNEKTSSSVNNPNVPAPGWKASPAARSSNPTAAPPHHNSPTLNEPSAPTSSASQPSPAKPARRQPLPATARQAPAPPSPAARRRSSRRRADQPSPPTQAEAASSARCPSSAPPRTHPTAGAFQASAARWTGKSSAARTRSSRACCRSGRRRRSRRCRRT